PDIVIADCRIAESDGPKFSSEIRAAPGLREISIILLSRTASDTATSGNGGWADEVIRWPVDDDELLARILLHLKIVRLRREAAAALRLSEARLESEARALERLHEASSRLWRIESLHEGLQEMLGFALELVGA